MHKNIVSNNLKEFVLGLEAAVKEGYSIVEESVDFHAGYFKALTEKEELVVKFSPKRVLDPETLDEIVPPPTTEYVPSKPNKRSRK